MARTVAVVLVLAGALIVSYVCWLVSLAIFLAPTPDGPPTIERPSSSASARTGTDGLQSQGPAVVRQGGNGGVS